MSTLGTNLKELRNKNNIYQKEIAEYLQLTLRNYQRYEADTIDPPTSKLIALADYFNVSLDYLVGRTDNPIINK